MSGTCPWKTRLRMCFAWHRQPMHHGPNRPVGIRLENDGPIPPRRIDRDRDVRLTQVQRMLIYLSASASA